MYGFPVFTLTKSGRCLRKSYVGHIVPELENVPQGIVDLQLGNRRVGSCGLVDAACSVGRFQM